ncbi:MAG: hypothetical protein ACJA0H_000122, partial [Francisellaceae bacterium]
MKDIIYMSINLKLKTVIRNKFLISLPFSLILLAGCGSSDSNNDTTSIDTTIPSTMLESENIIIPVRLIKLSELSVGSTGDIQSVSVRDSNTVAPIVCSPTEQDVEIGGETVYFSCTAPSTAGDHTLSFSSLGVSTLNQGVVVEISLTVNPNSFELAQGAYLDINITNNSITSIAKDIVANFEGTTLDGNVYDININSSTINACASVNPGDTCTLQIISYYYKDLSSTVFTFKGANTESVPVITSLVTAAPSVISQTLLQDVLINADIWDAEAKIMSAGYGYEGIQGIPATTEEDAVAAGGTWNVVNVLQPTTVPNRAYTSAPTVSTLNTTFGYSPYFADATPICFSWPVLPSTVSASSFEFTLNTGETVTTQVASLSPNMNYNERTCVIALGYFGNRLTPGTAGAVYPTKLTVVNNGIELKLVGPENQIVSAVGMSIASGNPYETNAGPILLAAKLSIMNIVGQSAPSVFNSFQENNGIALYGIAPAKYRLRVFTSGGFSPDGVSSLRPDQYENFFNVKVVDINGATVWLNKVGEVYNISGYGDIKVLGLASLGLIDKPTAPYNLAYVSDNNNYIDIVLDGDEEAMRQITDVFIPTSGTNSETGVTYQPFYNPGGPGNNPPPGVTYTQPGPEQLISVIMAIDDPM